MKIKTDSGAIDVVADSTYRRFVESYISNGGFSGRETLWAASNMAKQIRKEFPSMSHKDIGKLVAACFKHRPSEAYLEAITGTVFTKEKA